MGYITFFFFFLLMKPVMAKRPVDISVFCFLQSFFHYVLVDWPKLNILNWIGLGMILVKTQWPWRMVHKWTFFWLASLGEDNKHIPSTGKVHLQSICYRIRTSERSILASSSPPAKTKKVKLKREKWRCPCRCRSEKNARTKQVRVRVCPRVHMWRVKPVK